VISGNTGNGVRIDTSPNPQYSAPSGTEILGNYIGLGRDGSTAIGNSQNGVLVANAMQTTMAAATPPKEMSSPQRE